MIKHKNESGQVLVIVALSMTAVLGFAAFATDVGLMLSQRRMAQTAADAAALAAATESMNEGTPSSVTSGMTTAATHDAAMNGFNAGNGTSVTLLIGSDIEIPAYRSAGYVESVVSVTSHPVFMATFGTLFGHDYSSMNVSATAIASNSIESNGCIYVQNGGALANPAVDMGGNSLIAASSCGMTVNGNLTMGGNGSIDALFVDVSGTYSGKNAGAWNEGVSPQNDPLPKLQENIPTVPSGTVAGGNCTAPTGSGENCVYDYGCGSTSCTLSNVTLQPTTPTIYYFDEPVTVSGQVTLTNATIYLAGNTYFDFDSNGNGTFTPPGYGSTTGCQGSSNPFCGVMIDAPTDGSNNGGTYNCSSGKGNNGGNPGELYFDFGSSTTKMEGVVYAPYMQAFGQDKGSSTTFAADLIVGNICMQSATFDVDGYSGPQSPLTRVGLVY